MSGANIRNYFEHLGEFPIEGFFDGCGTAGDALRRSRGFFDGEFTPGVFGTVHETAVIKGGVYIAEGAVIGPMCMIEGPVYIGVNCTVSHGAHIRPYSILAEKCSVGHASEVKNTIMQRGSKVASLAFAGDSVLGVSARVGSGVILANRKFNQSSVGVKIDGEYTDMRTDFFGCVLGDSSRMGANCVSLPGTHIGAYTWVLPGCVVKGHVPGGVRVAAKQELEYAPNERIELKG